MSFGRVVSSVVSCAAVAGCAVVVVGMTRANSAPTADERARVAAGPSATERPAYLPRTDSPSSSSSSSSLSAPVAPPSAPTSTSVKLPAAPTSTVASAPVTSVAVPVAPPTPARAAVVPARTVVPAAPTTAAPRRAPVSRRAASTPAPRPKAEPAAVGQALPLRYSTGNATRVVTVTASSSRSTKATLQAWTKVATNRWKKYGSAMTANVGSDGIGSASETRSKTPAGSWTMTQAFGRKGDPGTALPYLKTTPSDYWISSPGRLYNTRQRCASCGYDNGVNERLYYETPYYDYAVVIDYNTRNAPGGVKAGRGSAFFLHVSDGSATAGCVSIPQTRLVSLMRWLSPAAHPRILIGVR